MTPVAQDKISQTIYKTSDNKSYRQFVTVIKDLKGCQCGSCGQNVIFDQIYNAFSLFEHIVDVCAVSTVLVHRSARAFLDGFSNHLCILGWRQHVQSLLYSFLSCIYAFQNEFFFLFRRGQQSIIQIFRVSQNLHCWLLF